MNEETYMQSWATAALALLSAMYVSGDLSEAHRNDIECAVSTAPDEIVLPAVILRPIFLDD